MAAADVPDWLPLLHAERVRFGIEAEAWKRALIGLVGAARLRTWDELRAWHDDLLFLLAYAETPTTRRLAARELERIAVRMAALPAREQSRGDDSGVAGTVSRHTFCAGIVRALLRTGRGRAEIDWRAMPAAQADAAIRLALGPTERDAFDTGEFGTRAVLAAARPRGQEGDLRWLFASGGATRAARERFDAEWDAAEVPVRWALGVDGVSVTRNRLPAPRPAWRTALRRPPADPVARIATPLPGVERLPRRAARRVIDCARLALAARCREVLPVTHANVDEVWWCDLGEGAAVAVIGPVPGARLPLEVNTGYLLLQNGVPVGYGGVTSVFRQANTGINVFDPFRGGEAAFLWMEMLRAFATLYPVRRFIVNPYQFGAGNDEALASGAFWFYWRLGFRPVDAGIARQATREAARLRRASGQGAAARRASGAAAARTPRALLRELASCDLVLDLPGWDARDAIDESHLAHAGLAAARALAATGRIDRAAAQRACAEEVARRLGADARGGSPAGRESFAQLAPLVSQFSSLDAWSVAERREAAELMRAKGAAQERGFAARMAAHPRFGRALRDVLAAAVRSSR